MLFKRCFRRALAAGGQGSGAYTTEWNDTKHNIGIFHSWIGKEISIIISA